MPVQIRTRRRLSGDAEGSGSSDPDGDALTSCGALSSHAEHHHRSFVRTGIAPRQTFTPMSMAPMLALEASEAESV